MLSGLKILEMSDGNAFVQCSLFITGHQLDKIHGSHVIVTLHFSGHSTRELGHRVVDQREWCGNSIAHSVLQRRQWKGRRGLSWLLQEKCILRNVRVRYGCDVNFLTNCTPSLVSLATRARWTLIKCIHIMLGLTAIPSDRHSLHRLIFSKLKPAAVNTWLFQTRDRSTRNFYSVILWRESIFVLWR